MADFVFNVAKGRVVTYAALPAANDALVIVPLEAAGLEADATLKDYDTLAALLAGTNNEQMTIGRKTLNSGIVTTVDDTNNWVNVDAPDQTWYGATGYPIGALVICYDPDTGTSTDADRIPLTKHDFVVSPDGTDIIAQISSYGFFRAA